MAGLPLSVARGSSLIPADRRGAAWRWLADQVATDPLVRRTGALVTTSIGAPAEDDPASPGRSRIWLDFAAEPETEYASTGAGRRSMRAPALLWITVAVPPGRPGEEATTLLGIVQEAAYRIARTRFDAARAAGLAWVEPGGGPTPTADGHLVGSVRLVVFVTR